MKRYKLIIAYDGSDYHGWQVQPGLPTIAGTLESTFEHAFSKKISLLAASRTDAGVHAQGQVATFDTEPFIAPHEMMTIWNRSVPGAIQLREITEHDLTFNVFAARQKTYIYSFFTQKPSPFQARFGWHYQKPVNFQKLKEVLPLFVGTHDFKAFSTGDERGEDTVRTVDAIELGYNAQAENHTITIKGQKFLHHMVRRIVGASLAVASRKTLSLDYIRAVFAGKKSSSWLINAPAQGLMLHRIDYE